MISTVGDIQTQQDLARHTQDNHNTAQLYLNTDISSNNNDDGNLCMLYYLHSNLNISFKKCKQKTGRTDTGYMQDTWEHKMDKISLNYTSNYTLSTRSIQLQNYTFGENKI